MDPSPFTLRQLSQMARDRERNEWERTAVVLCMIHNVHCARQSHQKTPADYNPFHQSDPVVMHLSPTESIHHLKSVLLK